MALPSAAVIGTPVTITGSATITVTPPASAGNYQLLILTSAGGGDTLTTPAGWALRGDVTITSPGTSPNDRGGTQHLWVLSQGQDGGVTTPSAANVTVTKSTTRRWAGVRISWTSVQAVTYLSATPTAAATSSATGSTTHTTSGLTPPANTDATVVGICAIDIGPDNTATTITPPASPWVSLVNYKSAAATEGQLIAASAREVTGTASPSAITAAFTTSGAEEAGLMPVLLHGTTSATSAPTVSAGADAGGTVGVEFARTATESDNGSAITARGWSVVSGPSQVGPLNSTLAVAFTPTSVGTYVLRFSATNAIDTTADDMTLTVTAAGSTPPTFDTVGSVLVGAASQTTANVPAPAGLAVDDIVLISLYKENGATVTLPSGFAEVGTPAITVSPDPQWHHLYWKRATGSEPSTYNFSWTGATYRAAVAHSYAGCVTTGSPVDVVNTAQRDSAGTVTPAVAVTTTGPNRLLVWIGSSFSNVTWTAPSGYTLRAPTSGLLVLGVATKPQAVAGASGSVTGTQAEGSDHQTARLVALLPAASAAPPTVDAGADVASHTVSTAFTRTATETGSGITTRAWTITAGPTGVGTTIGTAAALSWTPTTIGTYTLQYAATNPDGTGTNTMSITVVSGGGGLLPTTIVRSNEVFSSTGTAANTFGTAPAANALVLAVLSVNKNAGTMTPPASFTTRATYAFTSVSGAVASATAVNGGTWSWTGQVEGVTGLFETDITGWSYRSSVTVPSPADDTAVGTLTADLGSAPATGTVYAIVGVDSSWDDSGPFATAPTWSGGYTQVGIFQDAVLATSPYGGAAFAIAKKDVAAGDSTALTVSWTAVDQAYLHLVEFDVTAVGGGGGGTPGTLTSSWLGIDKVGLVLSGGTGAVRVDFSTSSGMTSPTASVDVTPDSLGNAHVPIPAGLTPDSTYFYRAFRGGSYLGTATQFRTLPASGSFSFGFASCRSHTASEPSPDPSALADVKTRGADLFLQTGDIHYRDISSNTPASFRTGFDELYTRSNFAALLTTVPTAYVWSDHDYGGDASYSGTASKPAAQSVYRERVPSPTLPSATGGIYHTFVVGRVRFIMLDTRSYRSIWTATDNSSKTMLGTEQKAWLQNLLATVTEPISFVISDVGWIGGGGEDDHWGAYNTERSEIAPWISAAQTEVVMLCGDAHMLAIDNGSNAAGGCHVWHAAALNRFTSTKGGPYSGGTFPGNNQYGYVTISDTGSSISATYQGIKSDTTVWNTDVVTVTSAANPGAFLPFFG